MAKETTIITELRTIIPTEYKIYYILFKYAPELLPKKFKSFSELKQNYSCFPKTTTPQNAEKWLIETQVQSGIKFLLKRLHQKKLIELYNVYYKRALEDTNAFKAFNDFSDKFFTDDGGNELENILNGVNLDERA